MVLSDKGRASEVPEIKSLYVFGLNMPVLQALLTGFHSEGA
jgi:hypothetical protein